MAKTNLRRWATAVAGVLLLVSVLAALHGILEPQTEPLGEAGSTVTVSLTAMPPPAIAPLPTTEPAPSFTPDELEFLQVLHEQDEFEAEYPADGALALIGEGICSRRTAGATVPDLIDWVDNHGYTSLASGWIVGAAVRELCPTAGGRR
jgi:hypothetical protein